MTIFLVVPIFLFFWYWRYKSPCRFLKLYQLRKLKDFWLTKYLLMKTITLETKEKIAGRAVLAGVPTRLYRASPNWNWQCCCRWIGRGQCWWIDRGVQPGWRSTPQCRWQWRCWCPCLTCIRRRQTCCCRSPDESKLITWEQVRGTGGSSPDTRKYI